MVAQLSALEKKRNDKAGKTESGSDWIGFLKSIVSALLIVFVWAIFGCNFMYLQNYVSKGENYMGTLFPSDNKKPPYSDGSSTSIRDDLKAGLTKGFQSLKGKISAAKAKKTQLTQSGGDVDEKRLRVFNKLSGLTEYSWPYDMKDSEPGLVGDFKAWIAESIEFSYINGRSIINKMFDLTSELSNNLHPSLILLLSVPIISLLLSITPVYGLLSTLVGMFQAPNKGWLWALVFLFVLGIDFIVAGAVSIWQTLQFFVTFLLMPIILDSRGVFELMGEHYSFFTGFFGLLVVVNAFSFLSTWPSVVMLLTYIFLLWKNY